MISFVIPAFNEEALLDDCLNSIAAEMASVDHEVIVVDNSSTDQTANIARIHGAKVISAPIKGVVWARQAGFEAADGHLIAFIDADSQLPTGWLGVMQKVMHNPKAVACSGPLVFNHLGLGKRILTAIFYSIGVLISKAFPMVQGGNCVIRRDALRRVGGFDTSVEFYGEDTRTAMRMAKVGKVCFVPGMFVWSSARRMEQEGFARIGARYVVNYFWMLITGRPWSIEHDDHRPD